MMIEGNQRAPNQIEAVLKHKAHFPGYERDEHEVKSMIAWINNNSELPCALIAAIAHYQFVTIHPYYDGNGRTARLLTTFILHLGAYDLKWLYSLEEY
jgi:Fic family protein